MVMLVWARAEGCRDGGCGPGEVEHAQRALRGRRGEVAS